MWKNPFQLVLPLIILNGLIWQHVTVADEGCSLNMNKDLPGKNQPLMLKKVGSSHSLIIPKVKGREGLLELQKGEQLILACPGQGNQLSQTRKSSSTSSCLHDNELAIGDIAIRSVDAQCVRPINADVIPLKTKCGTDGDLYEIGFQSEGWHPMITVCFNLQHSITYYSQHTLIGAALKGAEDESDRPTFSDGVRSELYGFDPNNYYKKTHQSKYFQNLFGNQKAAEYFNNNNRFLSRGHLAPDGDFLFGSWQFATYFYVNAAPQWQDINGGNWLTVEKKVRKMASRIKKDLMVITGTYGVLNLPDSKGKQQALYFDGQKLPIPEFFFKVVYDSQSKNGIGFVTSNNPYLKSANNVKELCKDVGCAQYQWSIDRANEPAKGVTYCCDVNDMRKTINYIPKFEVRGILTG